MNEENSNPFADFEQLADEELKAFQTGVAFDDQPTPGTAIGVEGLTEAELGVALEIAREALDGEFSTVMDLTSPERGHLATKIISALGALVGNPVDAGQVPTGVKVQKSTVQKPSPSDKKAAQIVQTPEQAKREKEFRDLLGL